MSDQHLLRFGVLSLTIFVSSNSAFDSPMLAAEPTPIAKPLFRDFMGVNGHTVAFKPVLYAPVCKLVRDYHPLDWDTGSDSDYKLDFPFARNRVNWEQVYSSWKTAGFHTDACIMFESLAPEAWKDLGGDANRYGRRFAEHFGPSSKLSPLVESIEIGNEPGKYSDETYRTVFESMASGIRAVDPALKIATCNVNVAASGDYHKSVECVAGLESLYDVLNIHTYAMLEQWPTWKRSYPEDPNLKSFIQDVDKLIQWRNEHALGKEVWVTEFGWDCSTKTPPTEGDFAKWQGNSDIEQAQWLVRAFFLFAARDIQRAYIYFFNDDDVPQLHGASGLTRNFQPKAAYYAVSHLFRTVGDYRFSRIVREVAGQSCVWEFSHGVDPNKVIWAAWSPTSNGHQTTISLAITDRRVIKAEKMPIGPTSPEPIQYRIQDGEIQLEISEIPVYLYLEK